MEEASYSKLKLEVLISAMHQSDYSILDRTNIKTDTIVINQCDEDTYKEFEHKGSAVKFLSTTTRGLSISRNKAIELSSADICLLCDDDEVLHTNYSDLICGAYQNIPDADVIAFKFVYPRKRYSKFKKRIGFFDAPKVSSVELSFRRSKIVSSNIKFNEAFGSGSIYGSGEENLFLYDCLRQSLNVYYVPIEIGKLIEGNESRWFKGFDEKYFFDKGAWLGAGFPKLKFLLAIYVVYRFRKLSEISAVSMIKYICAGIKSYNEKMSYKEYRQKR